MCCYVISFLRNFDLTSSGIVNTLINIDTSVTNSDIWFRQEIAKTILSTESNNKKAIKILKDLINFNDPISSLMVLGDLLNKVPDDIEAFNMMLMFITPKLDDDNFYYATQNLKSINSHNQLFSIVKNFKLYVSEKIYQLNFTKFRDTYELLWHCSEYLSYPEFYKAWHSQPEIIHPEILEISPLGKTNITQTLNQQIIDLSSQLKPTAKTYPLVINAQSLEDETDNSSIAQELCNQIYATVFPDETNIPEINNAPQLKRLIPNLKKQLNTQNLALIFHNGEPNESLTKFCKKLTDVIHIKWVTEQPIAYGIPPQENLVNILQNWINELD